ncbi:MAG: hypothetical protein WDO19_15760 [Bacteroidota bacterium]
MKIAITDACIFIDLYELVLIQYFFNLQLDVHTSVNVFNELNSLQQEVLKAFQSAGKLTVHNITEADKIVIQNKKYPNSLSESDKSVLYLAEKIDAIVISSDRTVRHNAKMRSVEYHGMFWILDNFKEEKIISPGEAINKLKVMVQSNIIYQNNPQLLTEMNSRIKKWGKEL